MSFGLFDLIPRELTPLSMLVRILAAVAVGGIIGLERERKRRVAGFRTYILVTLGSALIMMTGIFTSERLGFSTDVTRMGAQIVSGIGFLGAGTIMMTGNRTITGLTTAAGLWASAAAGIAVGVGFYELAAAACIMIIVTMSLFHSLEGRVLRHTSYIDLYVEVDSPESMGCLITDLRQNGTVVSNVEKANNRNILPEGRAYRLLLKRRRRFRHDLFIDELLLREGIEYVEEL